MTKKTMQEKLRKQPEPIQETRKEVLRRLYIENGLVKEQAVTFEQEIAYRQRKEIELENKLKKANELIVKLEKQLECKEPKGE